jgi:hypothetical protein
LTEALAESARSYPVDGVNGGREAVSERQM